MPLEAFQAKAVECLPISQVQQFYVKIFLQSFSEDMNWVRDFLRWEGNDALTAMGVCSEVCGQRLMLGLLLTRELTDDQLVDDEIAETVLSNERTLNLAIREEEQALPLRDPQLLAFRGRLVELVGVAPHPRIVMESVGKPLLDALNLSLTKQSFLPLEDAPLETLILDRMQTSHAPNHPALHRPPEDEMDIRRVS
jgi:hypothetical protein